MSEALEISVSLQPFVASTPDSIMQKDAQTEYGNTGSVAWPPAIRGLNDRPNIAKGT